jgi:hypothetical protein
MCGWCCYYCCVWWSSCCGFLGFSSPHWQLAKLVTRDSMIGVAPALTPQQLQELEQRRQQAAA